MVDDRGCKLGGGQAASLVGGIGKLGVEAGSEAISQG
jgi:hypothetical protein